MTAEGREGFLEEVTLHVKGQAGKEGVRGEHAKLRNHHVSKKDAEWRRDEVQERVLSGRQLRSVSPGGRRRR